MTKSTATQAAKPAKAKTTAVSAPNLTTVGPVVDKTPPKRVRKPAAPKAVPTTPVQVAPVVPVTPVAPVIVIPVKTGAGRPISAEAAKVRRRVVGVWFKLVAAGETEVTVKATAKIVKLKKVTVSNTIRWAESVGLITRIGYKLKAGPGRKEVFYTVNPAKLTEMVAIPEAA